MSRLSLRTRLTLVFAGAMAVVLAATGFVLLNRLASSLDHAIDQGLHARAADVTALVQQADTGLSSSRRSATQSGGFAQVLNAKGGVFDETPGLDHESLLTPAQLRRARHSSVLVPRSGDGSEAVRLLALPVRAQDRNLVVVVGASLAARDQALSNLEKELLIGGPFALLLAALIGYLVAAAALRPVEQMRARADAISARDLSERLPVSRTRDEIAALGTTLNELLERIETARTRERRFVADASHELRTPLALVRAEVELALEPPRTEASLEGALRSVGEEADRLSQLAEDLLLLARLDEGVLTLRRDATGLSAVIDGIATRFERRARDAGRRIETDATRLVVEIDRPRLEQALANLIENALRHGAGAIHVAVLERDERAEIHVTDEGTGFPAGFEARAFARFSRADDARSGPGAGLGLAIVRMVAEAHGGEAGAANRESGGADVWISVPLARAARLDAPTPTATPGRTTT
jgi:two-component system OmpR family sensor kinase